MLTWSVSNNSSNSVVPPWLPRISLLLTKKWAFASVTGLVFPLGISYHGYLSYVRAFSFAVIMLCLRHLNNQRTKRQKKREKRIARRPYYTMEKDDLLTTRWMFPTFTTEWTISQPQKRRIACRPFGGVKRDNLRWTQNSSHFPWRISDGKRDCYRTGNDRYEAWLIKLPLYHRNKVL